MTGDFNFYNIKKVPTKWFYASQSNLSSKTKQKKINKAKNEISKMENFTNESYQFLNWRKKGKFELKKPIPRKDKIDHLNLEKLTNANIKIQ